MLPYTRYCLNVRSLPLDFVLTVTKREELYGLIIVLFCNVFTSYNCVVMFLGVLLLSSLLILLSSSCLTFSLSWSPCHSLTTIGRVQ